MSVDQDSYTEIVYVQLLNEGTDVLRPVCAKPLSGERFRLLMPQEYDSEDEEWEFLPDSIVVCDRRIVEGEEILQAVAISTDE